MDLFIETLVAVAIIGVGLAMDAFAVSICDGITINRLTKGKATIIALTFGLMQGLMPLIGYLIGSLFTNTSRALITGLLLVFLVSSEAKCSMKALKA